MNTSNTDLHLAAEGIHDEEPGTSTADHAPQLIPIERCSEELCWTWDCPTRKCS